MGAGCSGNPDLAAVFRAVLIKPGQRVVAGYASLECCIPPNRAARFGLAGVADVLDCCDLG
jgi:hypothetical protein